MTSLLLNPGCFLSQCDQVRQIILQAVYKYSSIGSCFTASKGIFMAESPFMRSLRDFMLVRRYSLRTIDSYLYWIRYYIRFHQMRHPSELCNENVMQFLTHLAVDRTVAAATQAVALNALVFLYDKFLQKPLGD